MLNDYEGYHKQILIVEACEFYHTYFLHMHICTYVAYFIG